MTNPFLAPNDPLLGQPVEKVPIHEIGTPRIEAIIERMLEVAGPERSNSEARLMVGLAAPQIGINAAIILVDMEVTAERKDPGAVQIFINPEIVWRSKELEEGREGCYSVDERLVGIVPRPKEIQIFAYDRGGNPMEMLLVDFTARIFQHEWDHLQGIRFPDRVGKEGTLHCVEKEEFPDYRQEWRTWPVHYPWEKWVEMRNGG